MKNIIRYCILVIALFVTATACVQQVPTTAQSYFNSGMAFYQQGDYGSAIGEFNLAIELNPRFVEAHYFLGKSYEMMKMYEPASDAYAACIDIDANYLPARESMGVLLAQAEIYEEAKRHLEFAADLNSDLPEVYYYLGEIYRMEGQCEQAAVSYERSLSLAPGSVSAEEGLEAARHECGVIKRKSFIGGGKKLDERKSFTEGGKKLDERKSFTGGGKKLNVW